MAYAKRKPKYTLQICQPFLTTLHKKTVVNNCLLLSKNCTLFTNPA